MDPEERLRELGLELPVAPEPVAAYVPAVRSGDLVFVSGQGPLGPDGKLPTGRVGAEFTVEEARDLARLTCLNGLAVVKAALGDLREVERVVKLTVFVRGAADFDRQPLVANGASELLQEVFGEAGRHSRSAVGVAELPFGMPVEIEFVFQARPER